MNTNKKLILIFTLAMASIVWGCKSGGVASTNASSSTPANKSQTPAVANSNSTSTPAAPQQAESATKPSEPAQLIGTYEAREVQEKGGVVTLMSKIKTLISFTADGTFSRASQAEGKTYHTDSG